MVPRAKRKAEIERKEERTKENSEYTLYGEGNGKSCESGHYFGWRIVEDSCVAVALKGANLQMLFKERERNKRRKVLDKLLNICRQSDNKTF